jgi:SAM-dependent methyltransferase
MNIEKPSRERAEEIHNAIQTKYQKVARSPQGIFAYPIGAEGALKLGYDPAWLELVPTTAVTRFVGVGNPFSIRMPKPGDRILDAGCGCGFDTFIASALAGAAGKAAGIDVSADMLAIAQSAAKGFQSGNVEFVKGTIEQLPFDNGYFDFVLSNGVLNLVPDKEKAFKEIARVLRPEGALVAADLLVMEEIPPEVLASTDAWST